MNYQKLAILVVIFLFNYSLVFSQLFSEKIIIDPVINSSNNTFQLYSGDLNNDGLQEILYLSQSGLTIYEMNLQGEFIERKIEELGGNTNTTNIFDFNNDGFLDIIYSTFMGELVILFNDKNGNFTNFQILNAGEPLGIDDIQISDLNSDGEPDILFTSQKDDAVYLLINLGNLVFSSREKLFTISSTDYIDGPLKIKIIDMNTDGNLDLVIKNFYNTYSLLLGDSFGNFASAIQLTTIINTPEEIYVDFDADGDIDIFNERELGWFENDGNANFQEMQNVEGSVNFPFGSSEAEIADFDLDGDLDIASFNVLDKTTFKLFLNNGNLFYNEEQIIDQNNSSSSTYSADIDNNGSMDLVVLTGGFNFQRSMILFLNLVGLNNNLNGCIYWDENGNGQKDLFEKPLRNILSRINTDENYYAANEDGCYSYFVDDGTYEISFQENQNWVLSSVPNSYEVTVNNNSFQDLDFGFVPRDTFIGGLMNAVSGITRCNTEVKFDFTFQNQGTTVISEGILFVFQDSLTELASTEFPIDTTLGEGTFGFKFENLYPGETITRTVEFSIPGLGGDIEPGTLIEIFSATEAKNTQGFTNFFKHNYSEEIRCAYDPNDKLIDPLRPEEQNYTQFGDTLIYTVRFQNTGNDTAFNVVIRDTLDQDLDVTTFNIINSSHRRELSTSIENGEFVTFDFQNILLPDSTIDFNGSQGYVTYSIETKDGLPENTEIYNTASIYFDFNPPIVTNTTLNTMVTCFPIEEQVIDAIINEGDVYDLPNGTAVSEPGTYNVVIEDKEGCPLEIYTINLEIVSSTSYLPLTDAMTLSPNPNSGIFTIELDLEGALNYSARITNIIGSNIQTINIDDKKTQINIEQKTPGVYFIQLLNLNGNKLGVKKFVLSK